MREKFFKTRKFALEYHAGDVENALVANGKRRKTRADDRQQYCEKLLYPIIPITQPCLIQIPSRTDLITMSGMPAGGHEDQSQRLTHLNKQVLLSRAEYPNMTVVETDQIELPEYWTQLFNLIHQAKRTAALKCFSNFPAQDLILQALLCAHSIEYLQSLITCTVDAAAHGKKRVDSDIVFTPSTFAILVKDLACTLLHQAKIQLSIGLPTHHAFRNEGTGFCHLSKIAILIKQQALRQNRPLKYLIVGPDVNRDNGLCAILNESAAHQDICHVDLFDSRVYPSQTFADIQNEFLNPPHPEEQQIQHWTNQNYHYYAVDLNLTRRNKTDLHPALLFALKKMEEAIVQAEQAQQQIMIFIPMGWDSHEDENAACAKSIGEKTMGNKESATCRYNDRDFTHFYHQVFELYKLHSDTITSLYWGLEGGYERPIYEKQLQLMLQSIHEVGLDNSCNTFGI